MNKAYDRIYFHNGTTPALNESNLNAMSKGIDDIDSRVVELAGNILETIPQIQAYLEQAQDIEEALEQLSQNPPYIGENGNWYVWDTNTSEYVDSGIDASITVAIADITMLAPDATPYVTNTGTDTDPIFHLFIPRAAGISSIAKTSSAGLVDTYTITFENGTTTTFTVTNGENGHTIYDSAGVAMTQRQKLKFDGGLNVSDNVDTTVVTYGTWTQAVSCLVGDTTCTINDPAIKPTSYIDNVLAHTANGEGIGFTKIVTTTGQAVVTFSRALTQAASVALHIINFRDDVSFIPMSNSGGTDVLTTELALNPLSLQPNAEGNTSFIEYSITEPDTGYTPIAWNVKNYTTESFLSSCVTVFEKKNGVWKIQFKNLNTLKSVTFTGTLRIVWLKD